MSITPRVSQLPQDGGLELVVDDEGLLGGVDVEAAGLHLPLQVLGVLRWVRGRHFERLSLLFLSNVTCWSMRNAGDRAEFCSSVCLNRGTILGS